MIAHLDPSDTQVRLYPTQHAVDRFNEKVRPALSWQQARTELLRLMRDARLVPQPGWCKASLRDDAVLAELCDGIVAICCYHKDKCVILTVLVRGFDGEVVREIKRRARRRR